MTAAAPPRRRAAWAWGAAGVAALALGAPAAMLLATLLAPSIGAAILDRDAGRGTARVAALFGLAAAARPIWHMLAAQLAGLASWDMAFAQAGDAGVLALAWAGQMGGVLLAEGAPMLIGAVLEAQSRLQAERLRADRRALEALWGLPPAEESGR